MAGCVWYVKLARKRELKEDMARLAAAHAAGINAGKVGNTDLSFLFEVLHGRAML